MEAKNEDNFNKKKIYIITSNQSKLDSHLKYENRTNGLCNLKAGSINAEFQEQITYKKERFSIYINSIEILPKELRKMDQDPKTRRYNGLVNLKKEKYESFPGNLNFMPSKNNFIYDFEFKECKGWLKNYPPPPQIKFTLLEQLKLYIRYLKEVLKAKINDKIFYDLLVDSQSATFGKKYYLDYFLEIFKNIYTQKESKFFLKPFKLENILLPEKFNYEDYSPFLKLIEKNPKLIIQYCNENEDINQYYIKFYTLLLFVRMNYEKEEANEMLENKTIWKYLIQILSTNTKYFDNLNLPNGLINEMFEQKLKPKIIQDILSYVDSLEKILILINEKIELISKCYLDNGKQILISSIVKTNKIDKNTDLTKIFEQIEKIILFETNKEISFISFDKEFWNLLIQINDNDIKKLMIINKTINLCSTVDKNLQNEYMEVTNKILEKGLNLIKKGISKNEEFIDFINMDLNFIDNHYVKVNFSHLEIAKCLDFDTMTNDFFSKWNYLRILEVFSFNDQDFKKSIVDQVTDIKNFGKLLKLFDYKNRNIFDLELIQQFIEKFKNIINTYKDNNYQNFIEDMAFFIYIIDYQRNINLQSFIADIIEKYISSNELIVDIYIFFIKKYNDISKEAFNSVLDYLIRNKENLKAKRIIFILKNTNSEEIIKSLSNKIESLAIKEEELFNNKNDIESFQFLDEIQKDESFIKDFGKEKSLINILKSKEDILNKIKNGEIYYSNLEKIISPENFEIFKDKLRILYFNNMNKFEENVNNLKVKYENIFNELAYISAVNDILKEFFEISHRNDIIKIENLIVTIKSCLLSEFEKNDVKKFIKEIHSIFKPDEFEYKNNLRNSIFFYKYIEQKK